MKKVRLSITLLGSNGATRHIKNRATYYDTEWRRKWLINQDLPIEIHNCTEKKVRQIEVIECDEPLKHFQECPFYSHGFCGAYNCRLCHQDFASNPSNIHLNYEVPNCRIWELIRETPSEWLLLDKDEIIKRLKGLPKEDILAIAYYGSLVSNDFFR